MAEQIIVTDEKKCTGCNKCIMICPVKYVNKVKLVNGERKIEVDATKCISCGKCIHNCDHDARSYLNDSDMFWEDLKNGEKITLIVAPSFMTNEYEKYKQFLGYFKSLGVNLIYDASLGADITIWAYAKYILENKQNIDFMISQPCPSIVNYIKKYAPNLIKNLMPIQSPAINTAIYLKRYLGITDKLAFISPCIAKTTEIKNSDTNDLITYNITFEKICEHIKENNINLSDYSETEFDNVNAGLGVLFSKPGGLKECLHYHLPELRIKQLEGTEKAYEYLKFLNGGGRLNDYDFIDILSCPEGCNVGTASCTEECNKEFSITFQNEISSEKRLKNQAKRTIDFDNYKKLFEYFNETLSLKNFTRIYASESNQLKLTEPNEKELDEIYKTLYKEDYESKKINCNSCGYRSCHDMAIAIHNGYNIPSSCYQHNIKELEIQKHLLEESEQYIRSVLNHVEETMVAKDDKGIIQFYQD